MATMCNPYTGCEPGLDKILWDNNAINVINFFSRVLLCYGITNKGGETERPYAMVYLFKYKYIDDKMYYVNGHKLTAANHKFLNQ